MFKSRPLFLIVVTLCLLMTVIASYWVALMPQRNLGAMKADLLNRSGLVLDAKRAKIDIWNGFGVLLEDVTLSNVETSTWQLSAKSLATPGVFGGSVVVDQGVVDIDVSNFKAVTLFNHSRIMLRDGIVKLRDPARQAVVAVTDINGDISAVGAKGLQGQLAMVWGSHVSDLVFGIEDLERFATTGSPIDVTLKSKSMLLGFSGQGRAEKGLKLAGQVTAEAADIGGLFRWLGMSVQTLDSAGPAALQSGLETNGLAMTFGSLTGDIGGTSLKGKITLSAGADRPKLSGDLNVSALSLWGPKTGTSLLARPWPEEPLKVEDLAAVDLDLNFATEQLTLRQRNWGPVTAQLKSAAGSLELTVPEQIIAGGNGRLNVKATKVGGGLNLQSELDIKSAPAQLFLGGLVGFDMLDGAIDLNAAVKANGQSIAQFVSTLQGSLKLSSPKAIVQKIEVLPALSQPQKGWNLQESAKTENLLLEFDTTLNEGVAVLNSGRMSFNGVSLKPRGEIDILRQAVLIQLAPSGKNTDAKMSMTGQWLEPEFSAADILKSKTALTPPAN
jgi:hypothetical protein